MAKRQKKLSPPGLVVEAPKALVPLMQAFHADSDKAAKALITESAKTIYGSKGFAKKQTVSKHELAGISALMKGINPKDTLETLYAAQIVVCHMLGMRKLANSYAEDRKLGLSLLRFSNEAMQQLERKRHDGTQNITVNYNYNGHSDAVMQTVLPD